MEKKGGSYVILQLAHNVVDNVVVFYFLQGGITVICLKNLNQKRRTEASEGGAGGGVVTHLSGRVIRPFVTSQRVSKGVLAFFLWKSAAAGDEVEGGCNFFFPQCGIFKSFLDVFSSVLLGSDWPMHDVTWPLSLDSCLCRQKCCCKIPQKHFFSCRTKKCYKSVPSSGFSAGSKAS